MVRETAREGLHSMVRETTREGCPAATASASPLVPSTAASLRDVGEGPVLCKASVTEPSAWALQSESRAAKTLVATVAGESLDPGCCTALSPSERSPLGGTILLKSSASSKPQCLQSEGLLEAAVAEGRLTHAPPRLLILLKLWH